MLYLERKALSRRQIQNSTSAGEHPRYPTGSEDGLEDNSHFMNTYKQWLSCMGIDTGSCRGYIPDGRVWRTGRFRPVAWMVPGIDKGV